MRMPSASACQLSANFLSSSSAFSIYIEKIGPELSTKPDSTCDALFGSDPEYTRSSVGAIVAANKNGEVRVESTWVRYLRLSPRLDLPL